MKVAVDIVPWAAICRELGGEQVEVEVLVPPGASPHTYEPSAGQVSFLAQADLLVINGLELTPWVEDLISRVGNPALKLVVAAEAVPPKELLPLEGREVDSEEEEDGERVEHAHGIYDPHLWLDPMLVFPVIDALEKALAGVDPEHTPYFRERASELRERISSLHEEVSQRVAGFTHREFISFHSAWSYFARRYGLRQLRAIEERPGEEPSAREIAELVSLAEERGVRAIFAEAQFNPRVAEAVAEESEGRMKVFVLDPLGDLDDPSRGDYCSLILYNLEIMEEALR
ncbi:MAG: metal ABC transporter substrate-binding protein [Actinomycetota bacterium]